MRMSRVSAPRARSASATATMGRLPIMPPKTLLGRLLAAQCIRQKHGQGPAARRIPYAGELFRPEMALKGDNPLLQGRLGIIAVAIQRLGAHFCISSRRP